MAAVETNVPQSSVQNPSTQHWQRYALIALAVGGVAGVIGLFVDRQEFWHAYLLAWLFWMEVGLGGLGLVLLHYLAGGRWSQDVRPIALAAARTLPVLGLLFLPLLLTLTQLYPWADSGQMAASELLQSKSGWLNWPFFVGRTVVYFVVWSGLALLLSRRVGRGLAAAGMILYVLTTTFAAFDWMMSLEPAWFSSIYGLHFLAGQWVAGISLVIIGLVVSAPPGLSQNRGGAESSSRSPISGSEETPAPFSQGGGLGSGETAPPPSLPHSGGGAVFSASDPHSIREETTAPSPLWGGLGWGAALQTFNDLGNLLLAGVMIWTYFAYSQYLIIWSANLPEEAIWYVHRSQGGWQWVAVGLMGLHFVLPFVLLLSRSLKRNPRALAGLAGLLFCVRAVDLYWLIVPAFYPNSVHFHWLYPLLLVGMGGGWVAIFVRRWSSGPLVASSEFQP